MKMVEMKPWLTAHLKKLIKRLKSERSVIAIYLFGSHARGTDKPQSDVDICVITRGDEHDAAEIGSAYSKDIDLALLKDLPLPMKFRVFREGRELFVSDSKQLARIKSGIIKEYLDYAPVLNRLSASVLRSR